MDVVFISVLQTEMDKLVKYDFKRKRPPGMGAGWIEWQTQKETQTIVKTFTGRSKGSFLLTQVVVG